MRGENCSFLPQQTTRTTPYGLFLALSITHHHSSKLCPSAPVIHVKETHIPLSSFTHSLTHSLTQPTRTRHPLTPADRLDGLIHPVIELISVPPLLLTRSDGKQRQAHSLLSCLSQRCPSQLQPHSYSETLSSLNTTVFQGQSDD